MSKSSKNTFSIHNDEVLINKEGWDYPALTTYREDYYTELVSHTWGIKNGYPYNSSLGYLHRYIMEKWYGKDTLKKFSECEFIVEHLNNDHKDSRIQNLAFLKHNRNVSKGNWFDIEAQVMQHRLAISIYKDFFTGNYQITLGCNEYIVWNQEDGSETPLNEVKLLYNCPYPLVILNAQEILTEFEETGIISLRYLRYCDIKMTEAPIIKRRDDEQDKLFLCREDGIYFENGIGINKGLILFVGYEKGWQIPKEGKGDG